jgi:predicted lipoprotein with Yx(FWY)xxD motif
MKGLITGLVLFGSAFVLGACGSYGSGSPTSSTASSGYAQATASGAASVVATTAGAPTVMVAQNSALGPLLTDPSGRTLYIFKNDAPGTSNCNGSCATTWLPLQPPSGALSAGAGATGALAAITRGDGNRQVTYKGIPVYRYSLDTAAGDTKGQGIGGVWSAATP